VLDVSCDTGLGSQVIKSLLKNSRIVGLDCVPKRPERLHRGVYQNVVCGSADGVDMPNDSFDSTAAGEIIERIPGPQVMPTLHECFRLLRLKGRILLITPNPHYLRNRLLGMSVLGASHVSQHTPSSMRRKLEDVGFSHIHIYGSGKMSRYLGKRFPTLSAYGSCLVAGVKWQFPKQADHLHQQQRLAVGLVSRAPKTFSALFPVSAITLIRRITTFFLWLSFSGSILTGRSRTVAIIFNRQSEQIQIPNYL
jgi:hypothetical protein